MPIQMRGLNPLRTTGVLKLHHMYHRQLSFNSKTGLSPCNHPCRTQHYSVYLVQRQATHCDTAAWKPEGSMGSSAASHPRQVSQTSGQTRPQPRLKIISWNSGGLNSIRCKEVLVWLQKEHVEGRTYDLCIIQESAWPQDSEFVATLEGPCSTQVACYPQRWHRSRRCALPGP